MSVYSNSTKRPPQWSAFAAMLCVYHYQRSSTSILIASVLHGHFDFSAAGFRSFRRWRLSSKSRRWPENAWTTPSVVQRCLSCMSVFELTSNAAAQTYADVFVLSQLVVGGGSTQRVIFIYIKKRNRFGWNWYIYMTKNVYLLNESLFVDRRTPV